jgi:hypothetical protein
MFSIRVRIGLSSGLPILAPMIARAEEAPTLASAPTVITKMVAVKVKERATTQVVVDWVADTSELTHDTGSGLTDDLSEELQAERLGPAPMADHVFTGGDSLGKAASAGRRLCFAAVRLSF